MGRGFELPPLAKVAKYKLKVCIGCIFFITALTLFLMVESSQTVGPSASKSYIDGPGLSANFSVPARYFLIHAVGEDGQTYSKSPGPNTFKVSLTASGNARYRAWLSILDKNDGTFLVRYKPMEYGEDVEVSVTTADGRHVGGSPHLISGPVRHEGCYCPQSELSSFLSDLQCPSSFKQIDLDLAQFTAHPKQFSVYDETVVEKFAKHPGSFSLAKYIIKDNKLYRRTFGQHVGFSMFSDAMFLSLLRKVRLPDMEFYMNLGDWPLAQKGQPIIPILSWCGSEDTYDIVLPTYDITQSTLKAISGVSLDIMSVQGNTGPQWEDKEPKAFWRGRDSRQERLDLVVLSREGDNSNLINAGLTNFFFFPYNETLYGPKGQSVSFFEFFKYRYQLNIDGTVAAYRLPYLLAGDSLVFKQNSPYYEHFYSELTPWEHYVPLERDLSDVLEKIQWAKDNDKEARRIASNGMRYARERLMPNFIYCYHALALQSYSDVFNQPVILDEHYTEVEQSYDSCPCDEQQTGKPTAAKEEL